MDINANSYLFQEGTGDKYENARYAKVVLVDNKLRLIDLRDKDFKEIKIKTTSNKKRGLLQNNKK